MNVSDPDRPLDLLVYHQYSESYRGSDGTFKNLNTFLKITNITVDSTLVQSSIGHYAAIDLTVVQSLIRRLCNRQMDAYATVHLSLLQLSIRCIYNQINVCANLDLTFIQLSNGRLCNR